MDRVRPPVEADLEEDLGQRMGDQIVESPLPPCREAAEADRERKNDHVVGSLVGDAPIITQHDVRARAMIYLGRM